MSNAAYWRAQMRQPVRFADGIEALAGIGVTHFIEIGPHPVLCAAGAECLGERAQWLASMRRDGDQLGRTARQRAAPVSSMAQASIGRLSTPVMRAAALPRRLTRSSARGIGSMRRQHPAGASAAEAWTRANAAAERQSAQGPLGLDVASYPGKWDVLERITRALIVNALRGAGLFKPCGSSATPLARLGVARDFQPLVQRWLQRLVASGDLGRDGETCSARPR